MRWRRWFHRHDWTLRIDPGRLYLHCPACDETTTGWTTTTTPPRRKDGPHEDDHARRDTTTSSRARP